MPFVLYPQLVDRPDMCHVVIAFYTLVDVRFIVYCSRYTLLLPKRKQARVYVYDTAVPCTFLAETRAE
jgi:hypothetical protein